MRDYGFSGGLILLIVLIILAVWILASCVKVVPQAYAIVLERLGAYKATWGTGIHFKVPFIERVARRVNLKEQVVDFPPQPVITKDNVTMQIDTVVFFQITDPKLYAYGVENPIMAIENLSATTLRNIIGDLELDETLTSREVINTKIGKSLDNSLSTLLRQRIIYLIGALVICMALNLKTSTRILLHIGCHSLDFRHRLRLKRCLTRFE